MLESVRKTSHLPEIVGFEKYTVSIGSYAEEVVHLVVYWGNSLYLFKVVEDASSLAGRPVGYESPSDP